ncbi:ATP-binding cassette domain-containing protein [Streptomyces albus subsp. chlorinus]|uniref:ATP-binding cassette domain-containing protein n=1 Tax=Streptomyces albus TaxID=1888 RepID=UPI00156F31CF|nr:ATP-binding cassette domain-containing protein [Streptomyces albus subsp. chlorinus]
MTQPRGAAVFAEDFGLDGPRGPVFDGVGFTAEPGSVIAVTGPSGSGRTCLLLALTGRMRAGRGHAKVGGHPLPKRLAAVRRISALGLVPGVNDLDPALTVTEQLRERVLLQRRFDGPLRSVLRPRRERAAASRARLERAVETAGLDLDALPRGGRTPVRDLDRLTELRLSVALALLGEPRLLAVDDVDLKLSGAERHQAWALLRAVAETGVTVLAVCSEPPDEGAVVVRTRVADGTGDGTDHPDGDGGGDRDARSGSAGSRAEGSREKADGIEKEGAADALAEASRA